MNYTINQHTKKKKKEKYSGEAPTTVKIINVSTDSRQQGDEHQYPRHYIPLPSLCPTLVRNIRCRKERMKQPWKTIATISYKTRVPRPMLTLSYIALKRQHK